MVNLRTFDLNLLRVFEAVINDNSVTKAADKLGMSQPAVSNALNRLRHQLGDPLFVRTPLGMDPTPKARELAKAVNSGLTAIRAGLLAGTEFNPAVSQRHFTLLMTDVGEISFLPPLLEAIGKEAPHIDIHVLEAGLETYGELLESGLADLALGRITLADVFESQAIHTSPFVVLMSRHNNLIHRMSAEDLSLSYQDYLRARHIVVQPRGASADPVHAALGKDAGKREVALTIPHATALPGLMRNTNLVATIPKVAADNLIRGDQESLTYLAVPFHIEPNNVHQWWHRRNSSDAGHKWLRNTLANAGV
ncbi:LysR family transcriptional regulator [Blastomonas fulva]|jgi:DNA-binding transcriptional LysR family regulator|uniref:LysR family transcriptional regulator n=1 Tax=Blastomonas fulva TaxID=1550728 RepID=UPI0025A4A148|nr:LysR family transcriptional regulator [Blastomonas fulva]MDM7928818.1 LysR family transcriptional regulator [Blastomonas fulva]MDM7964604.1 LysR family transcriptional regulator [Blastomonas fulva]